MQLEEENERMFQVLNEYDQTIPKIVDEAITHKETQWKTAMNEVVSNSQIELKSLQDQLILSKRQIDAVNVPFSLVLSIAARSPRRTAANARSQTRNRAQKRRTHAAARNTIVAHRNTRESPLEACSSRCRAPETN